MKFIKKNWKLLVVALVLIFFIQKIFVTFSDKEIVIKNTDTSVVETFSLNEIREGNLDTFCAVETEVDAPIVSEFGGKITKVLVSEGDTVTQDKTLFVIENINQRLAVQNARVALKSAQLALSELVNDNSSDSNSLLTQTQNQQEINIESARNVYLNTDLQAYPEDYDETSSAPVISGNYTCKTEGEYIVEVYSSASTSGSSIRINGLETGRNSVSTDYSVALADCGLEIVFPDNYKNDKTWIIPVPNNRSSQYFQTKKSYENAQNGKDLTINQTEASAERIAQERARVNQASLQLEQAQHSLNKTYVKAPVGGILTNFELEEGDFVNMNQTYGRVKSIDSLNLVAYINANEKNYMAVGSKAFVSDTILSVESISPSIDDTKKIKVVLSHEDTLDFVEGTELACSIERVNTQEKGQDIIVPLSAISIIGTDSYVMVVENDIAYKKRVTTGPILGEEIVIYGIESGEIIRDSRSIRDAQTVFVK